MIPYPHSTAIPSLRRPKEWDCTFPARRHQTATQIAYFFYILPVPLDVLVAHTNSVEWHMSAPKARQTHLLHHSSMKMSLQQRASFGTLQNTVLCSNSGMEEQTATLRTSHSL